MGFEGADLEVWVTSSRYPYNCCSSASKTWSPAAPSDSINRSAWAQFVSRIEPKVLGLDRGLRKYYFFSCVFVWAYILFSLVLPQFDTFKDQDEVREAIEMGQVVLVMISVAIFLFGWKRVIDKNQAIDEEIQRIVETTNVSGYRLVYFTKNTGFCKPKGARIIRVFLLYVDETEAYTGV